jgi:hypothetical protein
MSRNELTASYRLYAANCIEMAQQTHDRDHKLTLLVMAQSWLALAENIGGMQRSPPSPASLQVRSR